MELGVRAPGFEPSSHLSPVMYMHVLICMRVWTHIYTQKDESIKITPGLGKAQVPGPHSGGSNAESRDGTENLHL